MFRVCSTKTFKIYIRTINILLQPFFNISTKMVVNNDEDFISFMTKWNRVFLIVDFTIICCFFLWCSCDNSVCLLTWDNISSSKLVLVLWVLINYNSWFLRIFERGVCSWSRKVASWMVISFPLNSIQFSLISSIYYTCSEAVIKANPLFFPVFWFTGTFILHVSCRY